MSTLNQLPDAQKALIEALETTAKRFEKAALDAAAADPASAIAARDAVQAVLARLHKRIERQCPNEKREGSRDLIAELAGGSWIDPAVLVELLAVDVQQIAFMTGLPADFAGDAGRVVSEHVQRRLRDLVEIVKRVEPWAGSRQLAIMWYKAETLPAFGDQTAEALVKSGKADALRSYLDGIAVGGYA